jgi:hypothetical protein
MNNEAKQQMNCCRMLKADGARAAKAECQFKLANGTVLKRSFWCSHLRDEYDEESNYAS